MANELTALNINAGEGEGAPPTPPAEKTPAQLLAEALTPVLNTLNSVNSRLDTIEQNGRRPDPPANTEVPSVLDNEDAAFAHRVGPLAQRQLETEARFTYNEVKQEYIERGYGEVFKELEKSIKETLEGSPLIDGNGRLCRGDAGYIRNVVDMAFGRHALANGVRFGGKDRGFFIESAGGNSTHAGTESVDDGLTPAQRKVFNRMGVSPADAKKTMGKLQFVS